MNDFLLANMIRSGIESRIASSTRAITASQAGIQSSVKSLSRDVSQGFSQVRSDMLEGMGGIATSLEGVSSDMIRGFRHLSGHAREANDELRSMGMTLDTLSKNMVSGFGRTLDHLENIQGTLEEIKGGVLNPELTKGLERYRAARTFAEKGMPAQALAYVTGAIENHGGLPLLHVPELRALRGVLYMGAYDVDGESVVDGLKAREDLEAALTFANEKATLPIKNHLATTLFALGDFSGASNIYREISDARKGSSEALFQIGRCHLSMSRMEAAGDVFRSLLRKDISYAAAFPSDPVCAEHPEFFRNIFRGLRSDVMRSIRQNFYGAGFRREMMGLRESIAELFNEAVLVPNRAGAEAMDGEPYRLLKEGLDSEKTVNWSLSITFPAFEGRDYERRMADLEGSLESYDKVMTWEMAHNQTEPTTSECPEWNEIGKAAHAMLDELDTNIAAMRHLQDMVRRSLEVINDGNQDPKRSRGSKIHVHHEVTDAFRCLPPPPARHTDSGVGLLGMLTASGRARAAEHKAEADRRAEHMRYMHEVGQKNMHWEGVFRKYGQLTDLMKAQIDKLIDSGMAEATKKIIDASTPVFNKYEDLDKFMLVLIDVTNRYGSTFDTSETSSEPEEDADARP